MTELIYWHAIGEVPHNKVDPLCLRAVSSGVFLALESWHGFGVEF